MKSLLPPELQHAWNVRDTVPRSERMRELAFAGYRIPRCGPFHRMSRLGVPLVVYQDELAHCGEGKVLYKGPDDPVRHVTGLLTFCSEYILPFREGYSQSSRKLVVGGYEFGIDYYSSASWMSNVDGTYRVRCGYFEVDRTRDALPYPMYAIDFVHTLDRGGNSYDVAVDLNVAPGVPMDVVNLVGRDVLTASVRKVCEEFGLIGRNA